MPYHYASEATFNASRTRKKPPSARQLAGATEYRGFHLFARAGKVDIWDGREGTLYGPRWLWSYDEAAARRRVDAAVERDTRSER